MIGIGVRERRLVSVFSTCKNCAKRYIGCHSECEDYIKDKIAHDAQQAHIKEQKKSYRLYRDYKASRMWKAHCS